MYVPEMKEESHSIIEAPRNSVAEKKSALLPTGLWNRSDRSTEILSLLSKDPTFKDGVIAVGDQEISIHCAIVAPLCSFFSTALLGSFREGRQKRIDLGETTHRAALTVVNFAYALDIAATLEDDCGFILEVWELAERLQIEDLVKICAELASQSCHDLKDDILDFVIPFYNQARVSGLVEKQRNLFLAMCLKFDKCIIYWEGFDELSASELHSLLLSRDLVASEYSKFKAIHHWVSSDSSSRMKYLDDLLCTLDIGFVPRDQLECILDDHLALFSSKALKRMLLPALQPANKVDFKVLPLLMRPLSLNESASIMIPIEKSSFCFQVAHFKLSTAFTVSDGKLWLEIEFLQRTSEKNGACSLEQDIYQYDFGVATFLPFVISEKQAIEVHRDERPNDEYKLRVFLYEASTPLSRQVCDRLIQFNGANLILTITTSKSSRCTIVTESS